MSSSMSSGGSPLAQVQPILLSLGNSQPHHSSNNLHLSRNQPSIISRSPSIISDIPAPDQDVGRSHHPKREAAPGNPALDSVMSHPQFCSCEVCVHPQAGVNPVLRAVSQGHCRIWDTWQIHLIPPKLSPAV